LSITFSICFQVKSFEVSQVVLVPESLLTIKEIPQSLARDIITKNHYSHKFGATHGTISFGLFRGGKLLGVAAYGAMMVPNSYKKISTCLKKNEIIELNRMWISDELGKNAESILISSSIKLIKRLHKHIKVIQSFADGRLGVGTIYKASNFRFFGFHTSKFLQQVETGEVFHKLPFTDTNKAELMMKRNRYYLDKKLEAFEVKTYRYIYALDKRCHINLKEYSYPLYEKGVRKTTFKQGLGVLIRLAFMYHKSGDSKYTELALQRIRAEFSAEKIESEIKKQSENFYLQKFDHSENILPDLKKLIKSVST
jgi:hypothetical protein